MKGFWLLSETGRKHISSKHLQVFIYESLKSKPLYKKEIISLVQKIYQDDLQIDDQNYSRLSRATGHAIDTLRNNDKIHLVDINKGEAIPKFKYTICG